jgi:hypothetical protein
MISETGQRAVVHVSDFEGRPGRRPPTYDEVQALFDAADRRVEEIRKRQRKGALAGSVALGVSKIEGDLIGEVRSHPCVVAAGVCVCWVPVPAGHHHAGRTVVSALHSLNSRLVRSWLALAGSCGWSVPAGVEHGLGENRAAWWPS